jgi:hypothetical protein
MYITVFYVLVALVWAILLVTAWVAVMLRKQDHVGPGLSRWGAGKGLADATSS